MSLLGFLKRSGSGDHCPDDGEKLLRLTEFGRKGGQVTYLCRKCRRWYSKDEQTKRLYPIGQLEK